MTKHDNVLEKYIGGPVYAGSDFLERYNLIVYDHPVPHIPEEDLRLAFGAEKFRAFEKYVSGRQKPAEGYYPADVVGFLRGSVTK